jgi:hypothetical protein
MESFFKRLEDHHIRGSEHGMQKRTKKPLPGVAAVPGVFNRLPGH